MNNQGQDTSEVFKGNTIVESINILYGKSKDRVVDFIKINFSK